jgi:Protein of unknown function (DUF3159)
MTQPGQPDGPERPVKADAETSGALPTGLREQYRAQLIDGLGGWSGTVIAAIPTVVFVVVNTLAGLRPAIVAAVGSALLLTGYRLVRRQSVQQALSGLFGVAIAVLIAARTGQARGYFLFGILTSFGYAAAFLVTLAIRRPAVGIVWEFLDPSPPESDAAAPVPWYRRTVLRRAYDLATALAAVIFLARAIVQLALYHRNDTGWLAVARIAMGYPLTIAAIGFGFWAVKRARRTVTADQAEPGALADPPDQGD